MTIRFNDKQAKAMGLDHLIPKRVTHADADSDGMNRLERRYASYLDGLKLGGVIRDYHFESVRFRLANKTWLLPDFFVAMPDGSIEVHECKGYWRDDARVKLKVAAEKYPYLRWVAVKMFAGRWEFEVMPSGRKSL